MGLGCGVTGEPAGCSAVTDGRTLCTCEVAICQHADPGAYPLSPSGVLVSDGWDRLHAIASDGEIIVHADATPTATFDGR